MKNYVYFLSALCCIATATIFGRELDNLALALQMLGEERAGVAETPKSPITKVNDDLYIGKKDDLYFVFERVTKNNIGFWEKYSKNQEQLRSELAKNLKDLALKEVGHRYGQSKYLKTIELLDGPLQAAIDSFGRSLELYNKAELWIAYATTEKVNDLGSADQQFIEMAAPILTEKDIPFYTPMGIFRAVEYHEVPSISNEKIVIHKNLSLNLHSFAAQAIKLIYSNKDFFLTKPLSAMGKILTGKLSPQSYWTNEIKPAQIKVDKKNKTITILRKGDHTPATAFKLPYFYDAHQHLRFGCYDALIDIDALAELLKLD